MLDTILSSLKGEVAGQLVEKAGIKSDQIDDVLKVVSGAATKEVAKEMTGGGMSKIMNLFSGKANTPDADSLQERIGGSVVKGLMEKLGFDEKMAAMVSTIALPILMKVISKKNDETPEEDTSALEGIFGGNAGLGGLMDKIGL